MPIAALTMNATGSASVSWTVLGAVLVHEFATMRSTLGYGSGLSMIAATKLKMAVFDADAERTRQQDHDGDRGVLPEHACGIAHI